MRWRYASSCSRRRKREPNAGALRPSCATASPGSAFVRAAALAAVAPAVAERCAGFVVLPALASAWASGWLGVDDRAPRRLLGIALRRARRQRLRVAALGGRGWRDSARCRRDLDDAETRFFADARRPAGPSGRLDRRAAIARAAGSCRRAAPARDGRSSASSRSRTLTMQRRDHRLRLRQSALGDQGVRARRARAGSPPRST